MNNISPLKRRKKDIKSLILYSDFETVILNNKHYVSCFSTYLEHLQESVTNSIKISDTDIIDSSTLEKKSDDLLKLFIDLILKQKSKEIYVYFHNFGKFDGLFILNYLCKSLYEVSVISRDNIIYEIKFIHKIELNHKVTEKIIIFRDSYLLFPTSLKKMGEVFNEKKMDFEHNNIIIQDYLDPLFLEKVCSYCANDAYILGLCFEKFRTLIKQEFSTDVVNFLTLSSLAFYIYRSKYLHFNHIEISRGHKDVFIRQSYKGGVVEVYKPVLENGYYYDVNSLYPYIMANFDMPIGVPCHSNSKLANDQFDINNFFGFISVKVKCPNSLYIPLLTINHPEYGLVSPTGEWKGIYFSEEIKYALTLGYQFEYYDYYRFEKGVIFKDYVNDMYEKRMASKDKPALNTLYKLLLNSLYGRFGMSPSVFKNIFIKDTKEDKERFANIELMYDYNIVSHFDNNLKLIRYNEVPSHTRLHQLLENNTISRFLYSRLIEQSDKKTNKLNIAVHIASAITAYARIYMHKIKIKYQENLFYSDTDSIVVNQPIDDSLISNTEMGLFKLEYTIKKALFIAPKLYYIELENGEIKKSKGINADLLNYDDFLKLYSNECIQVSSTRNFIRNLSNYTINTKNVNISINGTLNKRSKVFKQNKWIDTKPININHNNKI